MPGQGSIAVIAAWTNTGHQAMRNVVEIVEDGGSDVVTAFMPEMETQRTLLYGSNFVEIQPSSGAGTGTLNTSQTFTFSNDVDAIGEMWARIKVDLTLTGTATSLKELPALSIARIIDRMEVMVGNSTWQTIENADIVAVAATTLSNGAYDVFDQQARGLQKYEDLLGDPNNASALGGSKNTYVVWIPLPSFTRGGPERAHLTAGAPHQSVRVKLTYGDKASLPGVGTAEGLEVQIWNRQHVMSNAEREQIRNNVVAKTLYTTQHIEHTDSAGASGTVTVELDSLSLLCSHLIICAESTDDTPGTSTAYLKSAELLLNTSSHSGVLEGSFMLSATGASMGLETNVVNPIETSGVRRDFYVFPLAAKSYGPDGCPTNRFDTIRLKTKWGNFPGKVHVTAVGTTTAVYKNQAAAILYFS